MDWNLTNLTSTIGNVVNWNSFMTSIWLVMAYFAGLLTETELWVGKMVNDYIKRKLIEIGLYKGDFPGSVLKYRPSVKELDDSDWNIRFLHPKKAVENCEVRFNGNKLRWGAKKELGFRNYLGEYSGEVIHIPKDIFTEDAKVQVWSGKNIMLNLKFEDLDIVKE